MVLKWDQKGNLSLVLNEGWWRCLVVSAFLARGGVIRFVCGHELLRRCFLFLVLVSERRK